MPPTSSYRRYRRTARKTRMMGGIRKSFRGRRRKPMTAGRVKRIIGAELKFTTTQRTSEIVNTLNPLILPLTQLPQGMTNSQRDGNRISPVNVHGNITLIGEDAAAANFANIRVVIFRWDEDQTQRVPVIADIMQNVALLGGPFNIDNRGLFKVLWSRYFVVINNADNPSFKKTLRYYLRAAGPKMTFDGGAGADAKKYHLYLAVFSQSGDDPTVTFDNTFRYTDS